MRILFVFFFLLCSTGTSFATTETDVDDISDIELSLRDVRVFCSEISDALTGLKKKAGIGIGVSAVGGVSGAGALTAGIVKKSVDREFDAELENLLQQTFSANKGMSIKQGSFNSTISYTHDEFLQDQEYNKHLQLSDKASESDKKSMQLGNLRTIGLGINTAANITGAVVTSTTDIDDNLGFEISQCISSIKKLSDTKEQTRINGMLDIETDKYVNKVVSVCKMYDTIDLTKINNMVKNAVISNSVGAVAGGVGTVVSGIANSESVRRTPGDKKDNLNTASNILAGGATVASVGAVVFDAIQIKLLKQLIQIAEDCEGSL